MMENFTQRVIALARDKHGPAAIARKLDCDVGSVATVIERARLRGELPPAEIDTAYLQLREAVLDDWATGAFTRPQLAEKYSTSPRIVANIMNAGRARGDARARRCDEIEAARNPAPLSSMTERKPSLASLLGIKAGRVIRKELNLPNGGQRYNFITLSGGLAREGVDA